MTMENIWLFNWGKPETRQEWVTVFSYMLLKGSANNDNQYKE